MRRHRERAAKRVVEQIIISDPLGIHGQAGLGARITLRYGQKTAEVGGEAGAVDEAFRTLKTYLSPLS